MRALVEQYKGGYWRSLSNQKNFLDSVARDMRLTKAEDWFTVKTKGINSYSYHNKFFQIFVSEEGCHCLIIMKALFQKVL